MACMSFGEMGVSVQVFGKRLGQPVGESLRHDREVVVVQFVLELVGQLIAADPRRDRERSDVVLSA